MPPSPPHASLLSLPPGHGDVQPTPFREGFSSCRGFTLFELILVIVLLGILAAAALPRFGGIASNAYETSLLSLAGNLRTASMVAHSRQLADAVADNGTLTVEGQTIQLVNGYPDSATIANMLVDTSGYDIVNGVFYSSSAQDPSACTVTYSNAPVGAAPVVTVDSSGC